MNELTRQGIAALKAGNRDAARQHLSAAVRQFPDDVTAWLWLSGAVERDDERVACLRRVLRLDPNNAAALKGLEKLQKPAPATPAVQPAQKPVTSAVPPAPPPQPAEQEVRPMESNPPEPAIIQEQPLVSEAVAPPTPSESPQPASRKPATAPAMPEPLTDDDKGRTIFKTRPSLALALIGLWVLGLGVWAMNSVLQEEPQVELTLSLMTCGVLTMVVAVIMVRLFATRYELTTRLLSVPFRGSQVRIPIRDILDARYSQSGLQKLLKLADVTIEAAVNGELCRLRLRNLPEFKLRTEQILYLVRDSR